MYGALALHGVSTFSCKYSFRKLSFAFDSYHGKNLMYKHLKFNFCQLFRKYQYDLAASR